ncbi:Spindle pole body-associated protein CIK1 [Dissostichus eleginoides]|uniref:Spindle pole body-associated protein CIK1 n=1 Tax=Dissostichus eleginoides TaxID=100907 RepID=A0AAD9B4N3_DISEL|nr:Spindle pole body-associated protein CIK1 [Dissostichus eleginoides]
MEEKGDTWRREETPGGERRHLGGEETPGGERRHEKERGDTWRRKETPGGDRRHLEETREGERRQIEDI